MKKYLFILLLALSAFSCTPLDEWWKDPVDSVPPGPVTNVAVENVAGGAIITFTKPADVDLLGIKARYSLNEEKQNLETFVSAKSKDTITLQGFNDVLQHTVELFAVDLSKNVSEGVTVTIEPKISFINSIMETLEVVDWYGGVRVSWKNPEKISVAVSVSLYDSLVNRYERVNGLVFSNKEEVSYVVKDLPQSVDRTYRFEIMDLYQNTSFVKEEIHRPMKEYYIWPKDSDTGVAIWSLWGYDSYDRWKWRGDMNRVLGLEQAFESVYEGNDDFNVHYWQTASQAADYASGEGYTPFPIYATIDMGKENVLTTFGLHPRQRDPLGSARFMSVFEIWGSIEPKSVQQIGDKAAHLKYWTGWDAVNGTVIGGTDEWTKDGTWQLLGTCYYVLPSGISKSYGWPGPVLSAEDQDVIMNGMYFDLTPVRCRYVRFRIFATTSDEQRNEIDWLEFLGHLPGDE
jgi:hypothetical protein